MASKTKTPTATDTDHELETALAEARTYRDDVRKRAGDYRGRIAELRSPLQRRTVDHPEDFGATGEPKPDTGAAKLSSEIHDLVASDSFDQVLRGHEVRVKEHEEALHRHRGQQARELLRELEPEARSAVEAWVKWADKTRCSPCCSTHRLSAGLQLCDHLLALSDDIPHPETQSFCSISIAPIRRIAAASLGKIPTTSERRPISLLSRSSGLVERSLLQCAAEKR